MTVRYLLCFSFFLFPFVSYGAVSINEVAWMGSVDSANHEWIELYNDGEAVDVSGWFLTDGMNLNIELSGVIPKQSFAVLERTSDDSAPGDAFLFYTGALVNTGATLILRRGDGGEEDRVAGGEDWSNIGGDNITKETAQYTTGGWITAVATPGAVNKTTASETTVKNDKVIGSGRVQVPKDKEFTKLSLPGNTLDLEIEASSFGYVNQTINFSVVPSGVGNTIQNSLDYEWNFGDGSVATSSREQINHSFAYPGKYVVVIYGRYKRQEQIGRHEINILPVNLSLTTNDVGDVQINNDSPYEIDLSGYRLKTEQDFVFPPRTIILPMQTITIPMSKLVNSGKRKVVLADAKSVAVAHLSEEKYLLAYSEIEEKSEDVVSEVYPVKSSTPPSSGFSFVETPVNSIVSDDYDLKNETDKDGVVAGTSTRSENFQIVDDEMATTTGSTEVLDAGEMPHNQSAYLWLAGILLLGLMAVYLPKSQSNED